MPHYYRAAFVNGNAMLKPKSEASSANPSPLLVDFLERLCELDSDSPVLDLACGKGRNGLLLARHHVPVMFADYDEDALAEVAKRVAKEDLPGQTWQVDLEAADSPLLGKRFAACLVFNYLHRPGIAALKEAIEPGGLVVYETFTTAQAALGRPRNPDYLLHPSELPQLFQGWELLHSWEGYCDAPRRAMANVVVRKRSS